MKNLSQVLNRTTNSYFASANLYKKLKNNLLKSNFNTLFSKYSVL